MGNAESRAASQKNSSSSGDGDAGNYSNDDCADDMRHSMPDATAVDLPSRAVTTSAQRRHSISVPTSSQQSSWRSRDRPPATGLQPTNNANNTSRTNRTTRTTNTNRTNRNNANTPNNSVNSSGRNSQATQVETGGIERGQQATEEQTGQVGYWYLLKNGYTELVNLIIRPPRASYEMAELGPPKFTFSGREYAREDFTVLNDRQQTLHCSHWRPVDPHQSSALSAFPCMIYLHGNSSCRLESLSVLRTCLASGLSVVAFDCAGCGKSDGDYISLGYYERDDLDSVIQYLRANCNVSTIGLWGRSMGAATALLHADRDPTIAGIVVDSAFTNLEQLVQEIVERGRREGLTIPGFVVKIVMKFIRSSVQKRANFDIKKLSPIDHASISFVPALFVAAHGDDFIGPHHSDQLHAAYAGDKNIVKVVGDHNSVRPSFLLDSAGIFLQAALQVDARLLPDATLLGGMRSGRMPWQGGSNSNSGAASRLMMMDLEAALYAGPQAAAHRPKAPWPCPTCTFVNAALRMHCDMCQTTYKRSERAPSSPKRWSSSPTNLTPPPATATTAAAATDSDTDDSELTSSAYSMAPPSNARTI